MEHERCGTPRAFRAFARLSDQEYRRDSRSLSNIRTRDTYLNDVESRRMYHIEGISVRRDVAFASAIEK
jgi:hypothetical protein